MPRQESDIYPYTVTDFSRKDALILAPHPDDESFGCGGSIARHTAQGSRVKVIFITDGDKGDFDGRFGKDYAGIRRESAEKAMSILGVNDYEFWGYKDRNLHLKEEEVLEKLLSTIGIFSPSLIYAPSPYEAHPDHKVTSRIAMNAFKKTGIAVLFYEVLMALFPGILVDITPEMELKKKASGSYHTEIYYNDYLAVTAGLNRFRSATLSGSVIYAEGFVLLDKNVSSDNSAVKLLSTLMELQDTERAVW